MTTEHWHRKGNQYVRCQLPYTHIDLDGNWCQHGVIPNDTGYCVHGGLRQACNEVWNRPEGQEKEENHAQH